MSAMGIIEGNGLFMGGVMSIAVMFPQIPAVPRSTEIMNLGMQLTK
jgi:hypothetical protein